MRAAVIIGSSGKNGHTSKVVEILRTLTPFNTFDLNDYNIGYYDYEHKNADDDYLSLIRTIINNHDLLIFATPVYWYSMSGIMKVFFDRFTDLLDNEKETGRKLRGKSMAVLSSSVGDHAGENFWLPFIATAKYLGMYYLGNIHTIENKVDKAKLEKFVEGLNQHKQQ